MTTPRLTQLTHEELLHFSGEDSARFLQGQLTCDINSLTPGTHVLGACCNPKGRMLANFRLQALESGFTMTMPCGQPLFLQEQLKKYAVFYRQMRMQDISGQWVRLGVSGAGAPALLTDLIKAACPEQGHSLVWEQGHVLALPGAGSRFEIWLPAGSPAIETLRHQTEPASCASWQRDDMAAGIGWVTEKTRALWIPQELDWHNLEGVSFTKGCYTGQEIVARLTYRGKLKTQLCRFSVSGVALPEPGADIHNDLGKKSGVLVNAAETDSDEVHLLAVVRKADADAQLLLDGQPLTRVS